MLTRRDQLERLLRDPAFRRQFVGDYVQEMVATQIRAIRDKNEWTQGVLGEAAGMRQGQISRLENPDYSGATVKSLVRIARALDMGLIVRIAPFSAFLDWVASTTPKDVVPDSYAEEQQRIAASRQIVDAVTDETLDVYNLILKLNPPKIAVSKASPMSDSTGGERIAFAA